MSDLHEKMKQAAVSTQHGGSDIDEVIEACDAVAQDWISERKRLGCIEPHTPGCSALSRREHFAGLAMAGLIAEQNPITWTDKAIASCSSDAVKLADALLLALEVKP